MSVCLRGEKNIVKVECPSSSFESEGHIVSTGPVSRILSRTIIPLGPPSLADSSDLPGSSAHRADTHTAVKLYFSPIWSCSVWGLPCAVHCCPAGALLPHLFTLTATLPPRRYLLCGTFRQPGLNPAAQALPGTLLCGVRTFLSPRGSARRIRRKP